MTMTESTSGSARLLALGRDYYLPVYRPRQLILERGAGSRLWDIEGREYIDLAGGIAVCGLGHCDPDLSAALLAQAGKLWHTSNVFYSEPPVRLAEELVTASRFATRAFLCNSGAEANEAAIKLVRKWASTQGRGPERRVIVTFRGSFHGRTLAAVTATAQPKYQEGYEPLPGGFRYVDFNDIAHHPVEQIDVVDRLVHIGSAAVQCPGPAPVPRRTVVRRHRSRRERAPGCRGHARW